MYDLDDAYIKGSETYKQVKEQLIIEKDQLVSFIQNVFNSFDDFIFQYSYV